VAQVTGGSDFDFPWNDKAIACLTVLREAADAWARNGRFAPRPPSRLPFEDPWN